MRRGFTLIEVLIVVVILAVLAAIAIPGYTKTKAKNDAKQAVTYLRAIRLAEKMYYAKNGTYLACGDVTTIRANLGAEVTGVTYTFVVTVPDATHFTATATAITGGKTIILDQDGNWSGTYTPLPAV